MAIDNNAYRETHDLANTATKTFYPLRIPVSHWQLRHYISHPEPDILYYASGHDVYALNTSTKKRKLLATLPFEARCTAGGYGWVCVGGEDEGHFAAIKVDVRGDTEVDASLQGLERRWSGGGHASGDVGRRAASVKVERIGDEIVNSISIHRVQDEDAHLDDIVAVLTNNDKTVRVYSLPQGLETRVLDLPFAMNHATLSPDGQTMVAVGDVNQAFFFQREILEPSPQIHKPHNRLTSASVEWTLTNVVTLHLSEPASTMGYFTTAWSPSGSLVAVGSEGGYITVFDVEMLMDTDLNDEDAIVAVVPSSRPDVINPHPGAVRTMMFSPEPWDLLIWAEDQGRICIGDLRTGLKSRQVVHLDPKDESMQRVTFEDLGSEFEPNATRDLDDLERDFISRYRQSGDNATAVNFANDYIEARRRARQAQHIRDQARGATIAAERALVLGDEQYGGGGLTAQEQTILETLRTTRQREEARSQGQPRNVNYTSGDMFRDSGNGRGDGRSQSGTPAASEPSTRAISDVLHSGPDASFPELSRTHATEARPTSSRGHTENNYHLIEYEEWRAATGANTVTSRRADGSRLPRRRASVLLTPPATDSRSTSTATPNEASRRAAASPSAADDPDDENPWRTIEEQMTVGPGPLFEGGGRVQAASPLPADQLQADAERQRELAQERAARMRQARQRERWHNLRAELGNDAPNTSSSRASPSNPNPNTTLGERVDPSTLASERTLERYLERANSAADRWERIPPGAAARLPTFMSQGGEILLRRSHLRGGYSGREIGTRTAGLSISGEGRKLWVACEEGIFEVEVRIKGRLFLPAECPR